MIRASAVRAERHPHTPPECPARMRADAGLLHSRAVSSQLAVASRLPSGLNATASTVSVWPVRTPSGSLVAMAHSRPASTASDVQLPESASDLHAARSHWLISPPRAQLCCISGDARPVMKPKRPHQHQAGAGSGPVRGGALARPARQVLCLPGGLGAVPDTVRAEELGRPFRIPRSAGLRGRWAMPWCGRAML
jgi:hypothetical protein